MTNLRSGFSLSLNILLLAIVISAVTVTSLAVKSNRGAIAPRAASINPMKLSLSELNKLGLEIDEANCPGLYKIKGLNTPNRPFYCTHGPDKKPPQNSNSGNNLAIQNNPQGTEAITVPCVGNGIDGDRTQILYVRASDIPDHSDWVDSFRAWAKQANDVFINSAAQTGGYRSMVFVHDANCIPTVQNVVIGPNDDDNFSTMANALKARGFTDLHRKYLIFADFIVPGYCGQSQIYPDDRKSSTNLNNEGPTYSATFQDCWNEFSSYNPAYYTVAHEMGHSMGAVQDSAPHTTHEWHCTDDYDEMCYGPNTQYICMDPNQEYRFDCNKNDYFNTNPPSDNYLATHWNIADNIFLLKAPPEITPTPTPPTTTQNLTVYIKNASTNSKFAQNVSVRALYMSDCSQGCNANCSNPVCTMGRNQLYTPSGCNGAGCAVWPNYNPGQGYYISVCTDCTDTGTVNLPSTYEITRFGCGSTTSLFYPPGGGASCTIEVSPTSNKPVTTLQGYIFHDDERQPNYPNARKNDETYEPSIAGITLSVKNYKTTTSGENNGKFNYRFKKIPAGSYKFDIPTLPSAYKLISCGGVTKPTKIPTGYAYFYCQYNGAMKLKKWDGTSKKGYSPAPNNKSYGSLTVVSGKTTTVDFPLLNNTSGSNALLPDAD